ncbi:MAG: riboflavin synthase [Myxococcaceae bacterium]|nr:riboflavin synthase [Myxococcaceae bacterium]
MFTGLVQDIGVVERVVPGGMTDVWIRARRLPADGPFVLGESIAVDGTCLTVVEAGADWFRVQAGPETLRVTTLGGLKAGVRVNLERALRAGDRLGGHLVQGHVDAVTQILAREPKGGALNLWFALPEGLRANVIEKGSVTIDGISLTVATLAEDRFSVMLIPETQERTTLAQKKVGDAVNLEADVIGKYVARLYAIESKQSRPGVTLELLRSAGFAPGKE